MVRNLSEYTKLRPEDAKLDQSFAPDPLRWVLGSKGDTPKPVIIGRASLWFPGTDVAQGACGNAVSIAKLLNSLPRDATDAQWGFSMVPVRIHGNNPARLADVARTIELLKPGVEVVDAFEFVRRLRSIAPT